jgi:cellulose synthase (UDP-forming)
VRWIALVALLWGAVYLTWRVGWTHTGAQPEMYVVLLVAELVGWVNLVLFTFLAWRVPPTRHPAATPGRTVDVIVPTYDEPPEVLRATLLGCRALTYPHTTWLLDDGRRPEMAVLARELGANYLTRPDNSHAKAGNINHALPHLSGELIAVLDADHVPLPHFLDALVGYFDDDKVVLVQAPHEFYNLDSIQHVAEDRHEQSLFFRIICPGKDRHDGAFWCGSGTVIRREPLIAIGGVQTATIAEDFHTTIVLHQQGWHTHYHDETLLLGLAPHDLDSFLLQRSRWARGNLRVLLTRQNPVTGRGLRPKQRVSYFASLFHYVAGPQRLALVTVLCATLVSGALPLRGEPILFGVLWAPWVLLSLLATKALGRGVSGPLAATRHGWMTMGVYTGAFLSLAIPGAGRFKVTPKMGTDEGGISILYRLRLLTVCAGALLLAITARALAAAGLLGLHGMPLFALIGSLAIGAVELTVIGLVLRALVVRRQRRVIYRFPVDVRAVVDAELIRVVDLNHHGAGLLYSHPPAPGTPLSLSLRLPGLDGSTHRVDVKGHVRAVIATDGPDVQHVGVQFSDLSPEAENRILEYCHVLRPATVAADRAQLGATAGSLVGVHATHRVA